MSCLSLLLLLVTVMFTKSFLFIARAPRSQYHTTRLLASKHTNSYKTRATAADPTIDEVKPDPRKLQLIEKLQLNDSDLPTKKTGAELRKERKMVLHKAKVKISSSAKSTSSYAASQEKPIRFTLGCGVEALTAANLLDLVKSTAPYLFPEDCPRVVIEEDDFDDLELYTSSKGRSSKGSSNSAELPSPSTVQPKDDTTDKRTAVEKSASSSGWLDLLRTGSDIPITNTPTEQQRVDYFALCMASHFATVATFVPTDVDSKIRGHCWADPSEQVLRGQLEVLKQALAWEVDAVSKRTLKIAEVDPLQPISGHNGEWLGVLAGAWGAFLRLGDEKTALEIQHLIQCELEREAQAFKFLRQLKPSVEAHTAMLKLAAILTHNVGDVDQGLGYWSEDEFPTQRTLFSRLAHEREERFGGEFAKAKVIYKELISAEGHRNYPLREPKCLRMTADLQLPLSPWLEHWGRLVAVHPALSHEEKIQVARQLLRGCDSTSRGWCVPNQVGYYRALQGFVSVIDTERLAKDLDKDCRAVLKSHECRAHLGLSEEAFATRLGLRARELLQQ